MMFSKQTLGMLNLDRNEITADGAQHLAYALKHNQVIIQTSHLSIPFVFETDAAHTLYLNNNTIVDVGVQVLTDALHFNEVITENFSYINESMLETDTQRTLPRQK